MKFDMQCIHMDDNWSLKEYRPDNSDEIWFFRKNIGIENIIGHADLRYQVYLTVAYASHDTSGHPSSEDSETLYLFEAKAIPQIELTSNSLLTATVLKNGVKDHIFYVNDPETFLAAYNQNRNLLENFEVSLECNLDPDWATYKDFP